ncbi:methylglyoxal synthase [Oceanispirochaeta sp.]|uniref:methylglyoxal synthase n=1 Tax=Oceanispirochaeta sp. TaxID=2035350 RepID=UPI002628EFEB|nr:methylglyoxal synthase [Oceanispirochaeta sp.]MDA3956049.1 methylglyoxal synthase [Oceanispirochaeta sp.]
MKDTVLKKKTIALVAHDNRKEDLIEWVEWNYEILIDHKLICTGTTGKLVEKAIRKKLAFEAEHDLNIIKLKSGPLGGDLQLGALICTGEVDLIIFLWDPMQPQPHDVDVKALLRISVLYNLPIANNRATADYLISSPLFDGDEYEPVLKDYSTYINRMG